MYISKINKIKEKILNIHNKNKLNEEQTKTSLIMPMFVALGYDVFNIDEFVPEYTADFGTKQGEKVDYAICINGQPLVLIEAKKLGVTLGKEHVSQLFRYYASTDAKIAILTNGDDYWFFTDSIKANQMDTEPYLKLKISEMSNEEITTLINYTRDNIESYDISSGVSMQKYENTVKDIVDMLYTGNLTKEFMEYMQQVSGVTNIEKSKMAAIFDAELCRKFKLSRGKTEVKVTSVETSEEKTKTRGKWNRETMEEVELNKWYTYNEVKWAFHKPSRMKLFDEITEISTFKQVLVVLISTLIKKDKTAKQKLLEEFSGSTFAITEDADKIGRGRTEIPDTTLYVGTSLSGSDFVNFISKIMKLFNYRDESLQIEFMQ